MKKEIKYASIFGEHKFPVIEYDNGIKHVDFQNGKCVICGWNMEYEKFYTCDEMIIKDILE